MGSVSLGGPRATISIAAGHASCYGHPSFLVMTDTTQATEKAESRAFATTHWSVVRAVAEGEPVPARQALETLCRAYWYPVYAYVRRKGYKPEEAQDLTQEFFARLLAGHWLSRADAGRGRFRTFLLAAFDHFLANEWDRAACQKRGGGRLHLPFDTVAAEESYAGEAGQSLSAEAIYERNWALRFLEQVRGRLREEYTAAGHAQRFALLESFLPGEEGPFTYAQAARRLGVPEGTMKSDVHRLKRRYGELVREEIAHTVGSPDEIDDELRHLMAVLAR